MLIYLNNQLAWIKILFLFLVAATIISCKSKKDESQMSDSQMEALLSGIWIDDENESLAFMAKKDTLYYPDASVLPAHYRIYNDTIYIDGAVKFKYVVDRLTSNLFIFINQNGEKIRLVKTNDPSYKYYFIRKPKVYEDVNQQLLKRDTVVNWNDTRYHCYIQINPTTYRVVKNDINDEGVGVGKIYYDNFINVTVYVGANRLYSHDFKKQEFSKFVPTEIMRQSILSDITYNKCTANGVAFQAQLRIPESASSYIVNIFISTGGKMNMTQP